MKTLEAIDNFLASCQARNLKPRTIKWYREELLRFADTHPELPTEPEPIEQFLSSIDRTPETRHAYYRSLRALFNFIERRKHEPNPMKEIAAPRCPKKVMPTLEMDDIIHLLDLPKSQRDQALLMLFLDTGIRAGEAASLKYCDIKRESIVVRGKSGERQVPISKETRWQLVNLSQGKASKDRVFTGTKGPLTVDGIYQIVSSYMYKADIPGPKLGPHRLRHSFGKAWIMAGGDTRSLQQCMGHASITTTEKYVALSHDNLVAKHQRFSPLKQLEENKRAVDEAQAIIEGEGEGKGEYK